MLSCRNSALRVHSQHVSKLTCPIPSSEQYNIGRAIILDDIFGAFSMLMPYPLSSMDPYYIRGRYKTLIRNYFIVLARRSIATAL
jgi:hypothetical protein